MESAQEIIRRAIEGGLVDREGDQWTKRRSYRAAWMHAMGEKAVEVAARFRSVLDGYQDVRVLVNRRMKAMNGLTLQLDVPGGRLIGFPTGGGHTFLEG